MVHSSQFKPDLQFIEELKSSQDVYEWSGLLAQDLDEKYGLINMQNVALDKCSKMCWLGSQCDAFEYNSTSGECRFFPHLPLKDLPWPNFAYTNTSLNDISLAVLKCGDAKANVFTNNDLQYLVKLTTTSLESTKVFFIRMQVSGH